MVRFDCRFGGHPHPHKRGQISLARQKVRMLLRSVLQRLATARRVFGLSPRKMAEKLCVDPATLQGWETRRHQPTKKSMGVIARVLQIR
jgi:ribosome-binding protein aMBF1 (putative translation factor)